MRENEILCTEEIYRFDNNIIRDGKSLVWDIDNLVYHVKNGIKRCRDVNKIPHTIAIDTWGVDYVLLDNDLNVLMPVYCYRDSRTDNSVPMVENVFSAEKLYSHTGIQKQSFNTVYQLWCDKESGKMDKAEHFLMMPSYLSFCLTGEIKNEYTNATTTGMVNAKTCKLDGEIINSLGYSKKLFDNLLMPGEFVGNFTDEMKEYAGFDSNVIFCPSHDTASAVAACPLQENSMYVSSGTWSLIGVELEKPVLSEDARIANFANEGGIDKRFRFLKNYMGMWLFQNIRRNINKSLTYDEMMNEAINSGEYYYIDVNAKEFVAPDNMVNAIRSYLNKPDLPLGVVLNSVYHSLAKAYNDAVLEIESVTGAQISSINIVGGGCKDKYLNNLTAKYTGKMVCAGPVEATATGNLITQVMYANTDFNLAKARDLVKRSFDIKEVE